MREKICGDWAGSVSYTHLIYEAAYDDEIFHTVFQALTECGKGLCGEYNMPAENFDEYICIMMRRFADTRMVDPCVRPCRCLLYTSRCV